MATFTIKKLNGKAVLLKNDELTEAKLVVRNGADGEPYYFLPKGYEEVQGQVKVVLAEKAIAESGSYTLKERQHINRGTTGTKEPEFNPVNWLTGDDKTTYEALVKKATEAAELKKSLFADATIEEVLYMQKMLADMRKKDAELKAKHEAEDTKITAAKATKASK